MGRFHTVSVECFACYPRHSPRGLRPHASHHFPSGRLRGGLLSKAREKLVGLVCLEELQNATLRLAGRGRDDGYIAANQDLATDIRRADYSIASLSDGQARLADGVLLRKFLSSSHGCICSHLPRVGYRRTPATRSPARMDARADLMSVPTSPAAVRVMDGVTYLSKKLIFCATEKRRKQKLTCLPFIRTEALSSSEGSARTHASGTGSGFPLSPLGRSQLL